MNYFNQETISNRRKKIAQALDPHLAANDVVLVFCGEPIQKPGGHDQTYEFLPHPDYYWITGSRRSHGVTAYSKKNGWEDFVKLISENEILWEGGHPNQVQGRSVSEFSDWIKKINPEKVFLLGKPSPEQFLLDKNLNFIKERDPIQEKWNQVRRKKDAEEIELIKKAAVMANEGYKVLQKIIRPGITERKIQIEYEAEVLRAGADKFPYDTIVGSGKNAAVLHAIPTQKIVEDGEMVLIDAGADIQDYCVDITRVFSANGKWSSQQKDIYDLVFKAQAEGIKNCRIGVKWEDVHRASARVIAQGLKDLKILKGDVDDLLDLGALALFFPHGVGHMVGHRVRDVGGLPNAIPDQICGVRLRFNLPLEENFMVTVEPGIYFVAALLESKKEQNTYHNHVCWGEVDKWMHLGGVRIEDDILITKDGPQNITAIVPK